MTSGSWVLMSLMQKSTAVGIFFLQTSIEVTIQAKGDFGSSQVLLNADDNKSRKVSRGIAVFVSGSTFLLATLLQEARVKQNNRKPAWRMMVFMLLTTGQCLSQLFCRHITRQNVAFFCHNHRRATRAKFFSQRHMGIHRVFALFVFRIFALFSRSKS